MFKKKLYPKTQRMPEAGKKYQVTEKIDGSNISFIKKDGKLYIGLRKNVFALEELHNDEVKPFLYQDLAEWLDKHGKDLEEKIYEGSVVNGEWIGMGRIKYGDSLKKNLIVKL